jgi:hypothetical protein
MTPEEKLKQALTLLLEVEAELYGKVAPKPTPKTDSGGSNPSGPGQPGEP